MGSPSYVQEDDENIIMICMDIQEPLNTIKTILKERVENVDEFIFTLLDGDELDGSKNLLDHCVQGEGQVQINIELKDEERGKILNIVDVLKSNDDDEDGLSGPESEYVPATTSYEPPPDILPRITSTGSNDEALPKHKADQKKRVSAEKSESQNKSSNAPTVRGDLGSQVTDDWSFTSGGKKLQLWQFILELLTDRDCKSLVKWVGKKGEFKLLNPDKVALLWRRRSKDPLMNLAKMCLSLRQCRRNDMIAKVPGQDRKFVYRFTCDLELLTGYSSKRLHDLVNDSAPMGKKN